MSESKWKPSPAPGGWTKRKAGAFMLYASAAMNRATIYALDELIAEEGLDVRDQAAAQTAAEEALRDLLTKALSELGEVSRG